MTIIHGQPGADGARRNGKYRILSLDGGGLRTLLSIGLLKRIDQLRPGFLDQVDLVAGTSAGAISALIIAAAREPAVGLEQARQLWLTHELFHSSLRTRLGAIIGMNALTPSKNMARALTHILGDKTLGDLKRKVVIPAFKLDDENPDENRREWKPRVFHNFPGADFVNPGDRLVDLALRSSSLPIVSPVYQGYVDGGLFANNPTMAAVAQAIYAKAADLRDLLVFSQGAGDMVHYLKGYNENWGWWKWLLNSKLPWALVDIAVAAGVEAIDFQAKRLLPRGNYWREDPRVPSHLGNSVEAQVVTLDQIVEKHDLSEALEWVDSSGWLPKGMHEAASGAQPELSGESGEARS
uniref:Patatin-like protein n=1 Tax=Archangium disciforme TaxID=38 RepID=Q5ZPA5_9BACT|nr:patatin-like protein [Archangium disciforme]